MDIAFLKEQTRAEFANDVSGSFTEGDKVENAIKDYNPKMLVIGGGVSANSYLRKEAQRRFMGKLDVLIPPIWCTTDNAAMIAKVASHLIKEKKEASLTISSQPNMKL